MKLSTSLNAQRFGSEIILHPIKTKEVGAMASQRRPQRSWSGDSGGTPRPRRGDLRGRNAIEPLIGHLKLGGFLGRNFLKGVEGDKLNALLCGACLNLRAILRHLRFFWTASGFWTRAFPRISIGAICEPAKKITFFMDDYLEKPHLAIHDNVGWRKAKNLLGSLSALIHGAPRWKSLWLVKERLHEIPLEKRGV